MAAQATSLASASSYKRVLLKISGEALLGTRDYGISPSTAARIAQEIKSVIDLGIQVCMTVGGGNIFRGMAGAANGMDRATADYVGMLATVMNALVFQNALEAAGVPTRVQSAIKMESICEPYIRRRALRHMEKGRVVIFAAGTGNPFFTTDTAAALRASEMAVDAVFKATKVDGVYDSDPMTNPAAKRFDRLSYMDVLTKELQVMDASAITLTKDSGIPIIVFNIHTPGGFAEIMQGHGTHTVIS